MFVRVLALFVLLISLMLAAGAAAQEQTILSLQTASTEVQTGQEYEVSIRLDNVPGLWLAGVEISYDPSRIYVIGTKAGSPVRKGDFFTPDSSIIVFNAVSNQGLRYTISQLAPADLVRGGGVIGTFHIYPLSPGPTTLTFRQAELRTATLSGEGANRTASDPQPVDFLPALLELTISGQPVEPPSEATATPEPTETPAFAPGATQPPDATALVNVTLDPNLVQAEATAAPVTAAPAAADNSTLLLVAIAAMVVGGVGLVALLLVGRRRRR
jgi:hypothetical protein